MRRREFLGILGGAAAVSMLPGFGEKDPETNGRVKAPKL